MYVFSKIMKANKLKKRKGRGRKQVRKKKTNTYILTRYSGRQTTEQHGQMSTCANKMISGGCIWKRDCYLQWKQWKRLHWQLLKCLKNYVLSKSSRSDYFNMWQFLFMMNLFYVSLAMPSFYRCIFLWLWKIWWRLKGLEWNQCRIRKQLTHLFVAWPKYY